MKKLEKPQVKPGDWIKIGKPAILRKNAVVCSVYADPSDIQVSGDIEAVYLDERNRAINEDFVWSGEYWEFKNQGPSGGYADRYTRLQEYVGILKRGQH